MMTQSPRGDAKHEGEHDMALITTIRSTRGGNTVHLIADPDMDSTQPTWTALCGQELRTPRIGSDKDAQAPRCEKCADAASDLLAAEVMAVQQVDVEAQAAVAEAEAIVTAPKARRSRKAPVEAPAEAPAKAPRMCVNHPDVKAHAKGICVKCYNAARSTRKVAAA
jgi:hypothetical protein